MQNQLEKIFKETCYQQLAVETWVKKLFRKKGTFFKQDLFNKTIKYEIRPRGIKNFPTDISTNSI